MEINLHDIPERHVFGEALQQPQSVTDNTNGATATVGLSNAPAKEDHRHGSAKLFTIYSGSLSGQAWAADKAYLWAWFPAFEVVPTVNLPVGPYTNQLSESGIATRTPTAIAVDLVTRNYLRVYASGMAGLTMANMVYFTGGNITLTVP